MDVDVDMNLNVNTTLDLNAPETSVPCRYQPNRVVVACPGHRSRVAFMSRGMFTSRSTLVDRDGH